MLINPEKQIVISHLSEEILTETLVQWGREDLQIEQKNSAFVISPYAVEGAKRRRQAGQNLETMKKFGWNVTVINPREQRENGLARHGRDRALYEVLEEDENRVVQAILRKAE